MRSNYPVEGPSSQACLGIVKLTKGKKKKTMTKMKDSFWLHDCRWFLFIVAGKGMREGLTLWQEHGAEASHMVDQEVQCQ